MTAANRFELDGDGVTVTYTVGGAGGAPQLTYRNEHVDLAFADDEIATATSPAGTLVTVVLDVVPDHKIATFTLVVPDVRLDDGDDDGSDVVTVGLRTDERSSIAPARLRGQLQRSTAIAFSGRAFRVGA